MVPSPSISLTTIPVRTIRPTARAGAEIAAAALAWRSGEPAPLISYAEPEQAVWRTVCRELQPKHERYAAAEHRAALAALDLSPDRVPGRTSFR